MIYIYVSLEGTIVGMSRTRGQSTTPATPCGASEPPLEEQENNIDSSVYRIREEKLGTCIEKALLQASHHHEVGAAEAEQEGGEAQPEGVHQQQRLRPEDIHVLVVDDERMSRAVVSSLLKKFKYSVTTAEDGAEAMELLRSNPPGTFHLVLTDVQMPQMNGIELLQYIRSEETLRSVPVVMMSSFDNGDVVYDCVEGGAEEYLVKPVTQKEVQHIWQHVLKKRSMATTVPQASNQQEVAGQVKRLVVKDASASDTTSDIHKMLQDKHRKDLENLQEQQSITGEFLRMMRDKRMKELCSLKTQVMQLEEDCDTLSNIASDEQQNQDNGSEIVGAKRKLSNLTWLDARRLDESFFAKIHNGMPKNIGNVSPRRALKDFARNLNIVSQKSSLEVESVVRSGNMASPQEMVCCSDFDADDAHFATVSVSRSVKVFDFESLLDTPESLQFPVWQATTRSKLSSVSWNSYIKSHLITSDYDGAIQLWDVASGSTMELSQFEDHARRVWSIDFSRLDPLQFASASDDATVRIWNLQQQTPTACIKTPANACSVHHSPHRATMLAVACANHYCYLYDTRMAGSPLATLCGANRAVSYVRFMDANTIIGASTDNTVRLWDISRESFEEKDKALGASEEFTGHLNERNFVGLSVHPDGYIATGSEDNSVCCYYRAFPFALTKFNCSSAVQEDASNARGKPASQQQQQQPKTFVSSVCWARHSRHLLVGNSEGVLKVLQLKELSESRNEKNSQ